MSGIIRVQSGFPVTVGRIINNGQSAKLDDPSIDRWFNEPMDRLTEASQQIVDTYYDEARDRAAAFAREAARRLQADEGPDGRLKVDLHERLKDVA